MSSTRYAVIGGGIVGVALAQRLLATDDEADVTVLEKESELATHQSGRNSGVVHAGLYYPPGSFKARLCRAGVHLLQDFCAEHALPYQEIGKVVVALDEQEAGRLTDLVVVAGGRVLTGTEVIALREVGGAVVVSTREAPGRVEPEFDTVVVCAGLKADRLARGVGADAAPQIMPFRGEYYGIRPERRHLVNGLVYPVPDPRYPFLGVHLTPRVDGEVLVGPDAVLALAREGYRWRDVSPTDLMETVRWPGFAPFARSNWRAGLSEMAGSLSKRRFVAAAQRYVPELSPDDVVPGFSGVRAQAMDRDGSLVDDFRTDQRGRVLSLRNAPSAAATSSLAIAAHLVEQITGAPGAREAS